MKSRINSDEDKLSSIANLYVGLSSYYDWVNTIAHAYEITKLPMYAGNFYDDEKDTWKIGLLQTPFSNAKPYDTDLLSANTDGSPGSDRFAKGKYRAWKWLSYEDSDVENALYLYRNSLWAGQFDTFNIYNYYPAPLLRGQRLWTEISAGLSGDVMASIFDAWPGKYSYDSYNQMWANFLECAVCGANPDWNRQAAMIQPPLYDNTLETLDRFKTEGVQTWEFAEAQSKAEAMLDTLKDDLKTNDTPWLGGCSLAIIDWGSLIFHYGQLGFSDNYIRGGIVLPLLRFVDFFFDTDKCDERLAQIVAEASQGIEDFRDRISCPEILERAMQTDLSSPYPPWVGAGVDSFGWLQFRRDTLVTQNPLDFKANPKLLYDGYVAICDLYRSLCTAEESGARVHNRWASVNNRWSIGKELQIEREVRHIATGNVTNFTIQGDHAEVDIEYDDTGYVWKNLSTEVPADDNTITVARNQAFAQYDEASPLTFVQEAKLDMTSCFVTSPDLRPNPQSDPGVQNWIDRLFPADPEEKRQEDLQNLEDEYEASLSVLQNELTALQKQLDDSDIAYTQSLNNADVDLLKEVFTHFGYDVPQPVPHYPPQELEYDYYSEWLEPGIIAATANDPALPTEDQKVERQEQMWQLANDIEDEAWSPGGTLLAISEYWDPIISELYSNVKAKADEIDALTEKYWQDRDEIETREYHPTLPSQEDLDRIAGYFGTYGGITAQGQGTASITTTSQSKVVAPLSGYMTREYTA